MGACVPRASLVLLRDSPFGSQRRSLPFPFATLYQSLGGSRAKRCAKSEAPRRPGALSGTSIRTGGRAPSQQLNRILAVAEIVGETALVLTGEVANQCGFGFLIILSSYRGDTPGFGFLMRSRWISQSWTMSLPDGRGPLPKKLSIGASLFEESS